MEKETVKIRLVHPIMTGMGIAFGFFLFWLIVFVVGSILIELGAYLIRLRNLG